MTTQKWTEDRTAQLTQLVGAVTPVSVETVQAAAATLEVSDRSVASKLRKMGFEVASMAKTATATFTADEAAQLEAFVTANAGNLTYAQIAEGFMGGEFSAKQVQGKLLSMELTAHVKPTEKAEAVRSYTAAEEATFVEMCAAGAFVEDIAAALGKSVNSVRGKALSMLRTGEVTKIPSQKESHAKNEADPIEALGDISGMTVAEIATATGKTERGIKTALTRRGLIAKDYDGCAKKAKNEAKNAE